MREKNRVRLEGRKTDMEKERHGKRERVARRNGEVERGGMGKRECMG